jgi:prepilin-type N-terminal cleavage/methylation domain-containing protein
MTEESGFSLVELLVAMVLFAIVVTLGAAAVTHFWMVRSLEGGREQVVTQLRQLQQRVVSESHPLVYGARFRPGTGPQASEWGLVRYSPDTNTCEQYASRTLDGVRVAGATFAANDVTSFCREEIPGAGADHFVFFFARGNATSGAVVLYHPILDRERGVEVHGITGRVNKS